MEGFRMATSLGVGMLSDSIGSALESAQNQAREVSNRMQSEVVSSAAKMRQQASEVASLDISKLEISGSLERLRELSRESVGALGTNAAALGSKWAGSSSSPVNSAAPTSNGERKDACKAEDGSDSGAEEASSWGVSSIWKESSVGSRFGLGATRSSEKEQLVPKPDIESAGSASSLFSRFELPSWQPGMGRLNELSASMRTGLGMEKPKLPEGRCARLVYYCTNLTYKQRMLGFAICFALGVLLSLSALNSFGALLLGNPAPFAFKYTAGNLLAIGSSSFLVGPLKQCRDMFAPERRTASLVYVCTLVGTLVSVFIIKIQLLSMTLVICQFCALTWYMLSYIPYGQQCLRRTLSRLVQ